MDVPMYSHNVLRRDPISSAGEISAAFTLRELFDFQQAARYLCLLPYGRNSNPDDPLAPLVENRGTCSTKHALLCRLAHEQNLAVALIVGIYEMTGENTPGVRPILQMYKLPLLPEAHCYVRVDGKRVDVTRATDTARPPQVWEFLYEEEITPEQIREYKVSLHRRYLQKWLNQTDSLRGRSLDEIWRVREECIHALSVSVAQ